MKAIKNIGTTATIITFFIVGATSVLMFFHLNNGAAKLTHEYLGLVMVVACVLHIMANFSAFKKYFGGIKLAIIALCISITLIFTALAPSTGAPAVKQVYFQVLNLKLSQATKIFDTNVSEFDKFLSDKNLTFEDLSIRNFALKNKIKEDEILRAILPNSKR